MMISDRCEMGGTLPVTEFNDSILRAFLSLVITFR